MNDLLDLKILDAQSFKTGDITFTVKDEALDLDSSARSISVRSSAL